MQSTICLKNKPSLFSKCKPTAQPLLRESSGSMEPFPLRQNSVLLKPTAPPRTRPWTLRAGELAALSVDGRPVPPQPHPHLCLHLHLGAAHPPLMRVHRGMLSH